MGGGWSSFMDVDAWKLGRILLVRGLQLGVVLMHRDTVFRMRRVEVVGFSTQHHNKHHQV